VELDEISSTLEGILRVDFYNNDPVNFTKLPFHLYLSGMNYTSRAGKIDILSVNKIDILKTPLDYDTYSSNQSMWVHLDTILEPFQKTQFDIHFNATLPDGGIDRSNSHGYDGNHSRIYKCSGFYPMPCVYDIYDGWNVDPYIHIGDPFYFDMAYYDFYITVSSEMTVAATGELVKKDTNGSLTTYHFNPIYPVREVTFSASKWFYVESTLVNGVNVSIYFLPKSQSIWEHNAKAYASQALILFNESFGEYPYPTLNIVEEYTYYGGMEYPCQVYISEVLDYWDNQQYWLELIIVHEVAHQWWYNLIGNDEVDWGFLDEGLACWSESYYSEIYYGNWSYFQYNSWIDEVRNYFATTGLTSKINASVYDAFDENNYYYIGYMKTPLIIEKLRTTIGNISFLAGIQLFFNQQVNKIALLSDLQLAMESAYGEDLDWFFFPWFDNLFLPKYAISDCYYDINQWFFHIIISDLNEMFNQYGYSQQVPVTLFDSNNNIVYQSVWKINHTFHIAIHFDWAPGYEKTKISKVRLDYNNDVLVQLDFPFILYLENQVEIVGSENGIIPGYPFIFITLYSSLGLIYIIQKILNGNKNPN
jgi:hypothetical protein